MSDFFAQATKGFLGPIVSYLDDSEVSEIMVNGPHEIYIEKGGKITLSEARFKDGDDLMAAIRRIAQMVGKRIDPQNPIMDARLEDGSRVHAVIPPSARKGPYLTIRKFQKDKLSLRQLVEKGGLTVSMAKLLNLIVSLSKNVLVAGGTSSGKTTLLNIVSSLIPPHERIVVIEDASELQLQQEHVVPLETRAEDPDGKGEVSIRDLVKASLRMRPDRIVIGEVRGGEAMDLLQAMNTGHAGSMVTIHANTPLGALNRLETLAMMSDVNIPWRALRSQVAAAIDIIIQTNRLRDGSRKIVAISQVKGMSPEGNYEVEDLFRFRPHRKKIQGSNKVEGIHEACGNMPFFLDEAKDYGFEIDEKLFKVKKGA